jgi:hypothetical protein
MDPRLARFIKYCIDKFGDCSRCYATYNKIEFFYHNIGLNRRTGDSDLRKLRKEGYLYSKIVTTSEGKKVVFFYPTAKVIELCYEYKERRPPAKE